MVPAVNKAKILLRGFELPIKSSEIGYYGVSFKLLPTFLKKKAPINIFASIGAFIQPTSHYGDDVGLLQK